MPPPPTESHDTGFVIVEQSELPEDLTEEQRVEEYKNIIKQLEEQIGKASTNAIHFQTIGDVKNSTV